MSLAYFEQREKSLLGDRYETLYTPCRQRAERGITVNMRRASVQEVAGRMGALCEPSPFCPQGLVLLGEQVKPGRHPYYHAGVYYSQEPSASSAAALLEVQPGMRVLDLCAGTGCLGLGLRRFVPEAQVTCVEKSPSALTYLRRNVQGSGVQAVEADAFSYYRQLPANALDLLISNPPYLTAAEMAALMPETAREPAMALDGGRDGLAFYRLITEQYRDAVRPGGWLVLEIGCAQAAQVLALGQANGWQNGQCRKDYGGNDRVVFFPK